MNYLKFISCNMDPLTPGNSFHIFNHANGSENVF